MTKLQAIDDSNRSAHYYLMPDDECYFLHEFTARKGYAHSPGNQFIFNFKKSPKKQHESQYRYKLQAIRDAITVYRAIFSQHPEVYQQATFVPIPPSKTPGHPEYDDRMWQVVQGVCDGTDGDARELIQQTTSYDSAHLAGDGNSRIKPQQLQALYEIVGAQPRQMVILFDDVLSAGCHFRAAKSAILSVHPGRRVVGFFLARRVLPDIADDFDIIP